MRQRWSDIKKCANSDTYECQTCSNHGAPEITVHVNLRYR